MVVRELIGRCASILMIALGFAAVVLFSLPGSRSFAADNAEKRIVMIGLDASSNSITVPVPASLYRQKLSAALSSVHDSMAPVLLRREDNARSGGSGWHINTITVGLGLGAELGLGPLWSLELAPQLRLVFTNSKNPIYPH